MMRTSTSVSSIELNLLVVLWKTSSSLCKLTFLPQHLDNVILNIGDGLEVRNCINIVSQKSILLGIRLETRRLNNNRQTDILIE